MVVDIIGKMNPLEPGILIWTAYNTTDFVDLICFTASKTRQTKYIDILESHSPVLSDKQMSLHF